MVFFSHVFYVAVDSLPTEPWGEDWIPRGYFFLFRKLSSFLLFPTHSSCWKCNLSNTSVLTWKSLFQSPYSPAPVFTRLNLNQNPYFLCLANVLWTWIWANFRRQWRTREPCVLQSMASQNQEQLTDWTTATKPPKKWQVECSYLGTQNLPQVFLGS